MHARVTHPPLGAGRGQGQPTWQPRSRACTSPCSSWRWGAPGARADVELDAGQGARSAVRHRTLRSETACQPPSCGEPARACAQEGSRVRARDRPGQTTVDSESRAITLGNAESGGEWAGRAGRRAEQPKTIPPGSSRCAPGRAGGAAPSAAVLRDLPRTHATAVRSEVCVPRSGRARIGAAAGRRRTLLPKRHSYVCNGPGRGLGTGRAPVWSLGFVGAEPAPERSPPPASLGRPGLAACCTRVPAHQGLTSCVRAEEPAGLPRLHPHARGAPDQPRLVPALLAHYAARGARTCSRRVHPPSMARAGRRARQL